MARTCLTGRRSSPGSDSFQPILSISCPTESSCSLLKKTDTARSFLWLAAIQIVERIKNLPGLAPKGRFVAAEAVKRIIGEVREPQETPGEITPMGCLSFLRPPPRELANNEIRELELPRQSSGID